MIGEEDAVSMREYSTTVKCLSQEGVMLAMKTSDFYQRIKTNEETWRYIQKSALLKDCNIYKSALKSEDLIVENSEGIKQLIKEEAQKEDEIGDIDIFKTTFWGEPIPTRKVEKVIEQNLQKRRLTK